MKLLTSKFNEKNFFSDLSCTHGRTCVYGRYAPGMYLSTQLYGRAVNPRESTFFYLTQIDLPTGLHLILHPQARKKLSDKWYLQVQPGLQTGKLISRILKNTRNRWRKQNSTKKNNCYGSRSDREGRDWVNVFQLIQERMIHSLLVNKYNFFKKKTLLNFQNEVLNGKIQRDKKSYRVFFYLQSCVGFDKIMTESSVSLSYQAVNQTVCVNVCTQKLLVGLR